jgi:hypothetical protein
MGKVDVEKSLQKIENWVVDRDRSIERLSTVLNDETKTVIDKIVQKYDRISAEVDNFLKWYGQSIDTKPGKEINNILRKNQLIEAEIEKIKRQIGGGGVKATEHGKIVPETKSVDVRLLQAFSYTVFDTILFSITQGSAPDFLLISQSALFETVYVNISRGFESYLFSDVPPSAVAVIQQGRGILEDLREREDSFLDEPHLWEVYAPEIQKWWVNTALPVIFGERDPDWDTAVFPTHDEMKTWVEGEFSQRKHFPAVADLVELAKERAVDVSDTFNFKILLAA